MIAGSSGLWEAQLMPRPTSHNWIGEDAALLVYYRLHGLRG
jgi:hypothetical protein